MAGKLLTTASTMQCPHGGTVQASTSNSAVKADGAFVLLLSDVLTISGCPFQIPVGAGTKPSPCMKVQWVVGEMMLKVNSTPMLSEGSTGLCFTAESIPQGSVSITNTQSKAKA